MSCPRDFSSRATIPETVGVHAAEPVAPIGAPLTACGMTIYQRSWYLAPDTDVTCWQCRNATQGGEGSSR